jgi:hypothetical protein
MDVNLPHKGHTESFSLVVDRAGGVEYSEVFGALSTCRRMTDEEDEGLAKLWSGEALQRPLPQCGPGYMYHLYGDRACPESGRELNERRRAFLPYVWVFYNTEERPVSFSWDLESELPETLEEAFASTLSLLCGGSSRLAADFRRSLPELTASAGC